MPSRSTPTTAQPLQSDDLVALREARPTSSIFGAHTDAPLTGAAADQAAQLIAVAARLLGDRGQLFATWSIADADLALALMRLVANDDPVPPAVRAYALAQWQRPSVRGFVDRASRLISGGSASARTARGARRRRPWRTARRGRERS